MAFTSGSVSFRRFLLTGPAPADVTDGFVQALKDHAFGRHAAAGADGVEIGWITGRHLFDVQFAAEHVSFGRFAHFAMRLDRLSVPSAVLRSYVQMEEDAALASSGRNHLSRKEREQARDAAQQRVDREAKNGAFRRMAAYPVLLDLDRQVVYAAASGDSVQDRLAGLFQDTFGCALESAGAGRVALRIMESAGDARSIEDARPFHLADPPDDFSDGEVFPPGDATFLGRELLTWLWWRSDAEESTLRLSTGDEVAVMIDRVMRLECDFGRNGATVITADGPSNLPEARSALGSGKQPTRMGLVFGSRAGEFSLTLDGPRLAVTGLTLPQDEEQRDRREKLERRFEQVADVGELLNVLYELFLRRRTATDWPRELGQMRLWASSRSRDRTMTLSASA